MAVKPKLPVATAEQFEGMTLMRLRMENVMRVRYVDLTINNTLTRIGGKNKQGKSTLINGPKWLLGDKKIIAEKPIHEGKASGYITGDFGDGKEVKLTVTRTFVRVGEDDWDTDLDIEIPGHLSPSRVVEFVKSLSADKAVDPSTFDDLTDEQRFETCRKFAGDFDFKANAAARKELYEQRTDVGKDRDREYGAANGIVIADKPPGERVDVDALTAELKAVGEHNALLERRQANRNTVADNVRKLRNDAQAKLEQIATDSATAKANHDSRVADLEAQIRALQARIAAATTEFQEVLVKIRSELTAESDALTKQADAEQKRIDDAEPLPPPKDATEVEERLKKARETNAAIDEWQRLKDRHTKHMAEGNAYAKQWDDLTAQLAEIDQARDAAIAKAHLPVEGIGFGDGVITLHGKPWRQGSKAERAEASAVISMEMKPHLKFILFRDAPNMDSECLGRIQEAAEARGFRVLMEVFDETGANSHVFIEDGMVKPLEAQAGAA